MSNEFVPLISTSPGDPLVPDLPAPTRLEKLLEAAFYGDPEALLFFQSHCQILDPSSESLFPRPVAYELCAAQDPIPAVVFLVADPCALEAHQQRGNEDLLIAALAGVAELFGYECAFPPVIVASAESREDAEAIIAACNPLLLLGTAAVILEMTDDSSMSREMA